MQITRLSVLRSAQARTLRSARAVYPKIVARCARASMARVRTQVATSESVERVRRRVLSAGAAVLAAAAITVTSACTPLQYLARTVNPIAQAGHLSHATQHVDGSGNKFGCNFVGGGLRWRPVPQLQIDATESYSFEKCQGPYRETFVLLAVWEF